METPDRIIAEMARLRAAWHGAAGGRLRLAFGPLIPWGCTADTMRRTYDLARQWGVGTHIHVGEVRREIEMSLESTGRRHIEWLADLGVLGPDVQLVHSVWLDDFEIDLVAASGAVVVHCPVSNMYLASGSNNSQDMLETLKAACLLQKVANLDVMALLPEDAVWMACRGGAATFGQPDLIGSLEAGKKVDVVLVDLNTPFAMPVHKPVSALVYNVGYGSVDTVIVAASCSCAARRYCAWTKRRCLLRRGRCAAGCSSGRASWWISERI